MSGTLQIAFAFDMPAATIEVVAPDLSTVDRIWLAPGQQKSVEVPSEASFLRVYLASGETITLQDPGNLHRVVSLSTLNERRGQTRGVDPAAQRPQNVRQLQLLGSQEWHYPTGIASSRMARMSLDGDVTVRLLSSAGQPEMARIREFGTSVSFQPEVFEPLEKQTPYDLELSRPDLAVRVRLPGALEDLQLRSDDVGSNRRVITVRVRTASSVADAIGAYLNRGDLHSAAAMTDWAERAEELLQDKRQNPFAAAIGAYLLLRLGRLDLLHDWTRNLADWFPDFADGQVIRAWHLIHVRGNEAEIRGHLMHSAVSTLPVFTEGLRLLRDGLHAPGAERQVNALNQRCGVVLWASPFTTTTHSPTASPTLQLSLDIDYAART